MLQKTLLSLAVSIVMLNQMPTSSAQLSTEGFPGALTFGNSAKSDGADVQISARVVSKGADSGVVEVTAEVPEGYYIYSMNPSFGAATEIELTDLGGLTEEGDWKADHEPKVVRDDVLDQDVEKFFGKVTWSKTLKGSVTADTVVKGKLNGQYCGSGENGVPGECRPIRNRKFTAKVETVAETAPSADTTSAEEPEAATTADVSIQVVTSVEVSPKIGYGKSAKSGLINFKISVSPEAPSVGDTVTLSVKASIEKPYHTYAVDASTDGSANPTSIELSATEGLEVVDALPVASIAPEEKDGPDSSILKVHHGDIEWTQKFKVTGTNVKLAGDVAFQLCDESKCLAPSKAPFELTLVATARAAEEIVPATAGSQKDTSYYALIITAIGSGLLSLFTPCVYPMLPVTVAFFLKQEEKKQGSSLALAIVYSLSMVAAFTIFGVGMSFLFGATSTNVLANNPWLNLFFAAVFFAFALMFFGVFEVRVPSWLLTWTSKRESSGGYIGVVFMALTFTLVSFTCTFAFVGQIAILAQGGSIFKAVVGMVAFGATFASPFFLLAMFPSVLSKMPKSGGWMNRVKVTIGLVELAMVLKFLSVSDIGFSSNGLPVFLDRASFLAGWMTIAIVTGMYLLGLFRLSSDMEMKGVPVLQVLLSMMFFTVGGYIGVGLFSSSPPSGWIWSQVVALAPPDFQVGGGGLHGSGKQGMSIREDDVLGTVVEHHGLVFGLDFDRAVAEATRRKKALFIDFTGVNCPNCRGMEQDVLSQPQMISMLEKMVRVQLYTDKVPGISGADKQKKILEFNRKLQEDWFKDSALPGYAVVTSDGKTVLANFAGYDNSRGVDFLKFLNAGLQQYDKLTKTQATAAKAKLSPTLLGRALWTNGLCSDLDFDNATLDPSVDADEFPKAFNTDPPDSHPPTPEEMVKLIEVPPGFNVTLFAGEPDVQQPICMDFDDRGRLWVAENYTYSGGPYETKLRDRVVILEDSDGDGKHDSRKVFWDKGFMLTSLTWGFGGLWVLHDGTLSFIPDKNGDDIPDGEPVVMLDGWSKDCGHNFVSGLIWGPDGWLYGRHGIVDTSYPGVPGTPKEERPFMNCGVWRYHPTKHTVEVVCNGTTNPWGLDYNEDGQFFMTNNVQGHLWHVIPGARYQRMYGQDFNPYSFELMDMTADHYHWDTNMKWTDSRDGKANDLGGGHSHVGGLIYQGDNFPKEYFGKIFMCNTHGRRINVNRLDREGSGYVGRREPDFMLVKNPWFRGVDIKMGPEGAIYVADWSDNGECHDHDGVHRTSGRIYRIAYGTPKPSDAQKTTLVGRNKLAFLSSDWINKPDWFGRHARRIRQELVTDGEISKRSLASHISIESPGRLLYSESFAGLDKSALRSALSSTNPDVVAQAIRLAVTTEDRRKEFVDDLIEIAGTPQKAHVLLALLGEISRFAGSKEPNPPDYRLCAAVFGCPENCQTIVEDKNLTLMAWYAIEPFHQPIGLKTIQSNPKLLQFTIRRLAMEIDQPYIHMGLASVLRFIAEEAESEDAVRRAGAPDLLKAFLTGLSGRARVKAPSNWAEVYNRFQAAKSDDLRSTADQLAAIFGDGAAIEDLRKLAGDSSQDYVAREQSILALAQAKDEESIPMFFNLLGDRAVYSTVIQALAGFDHPDTAKQLLSKMGGFKDGNRSLAFDTMASRESYALELIKAVEEGRVDARELTASQVRQLMALGNDHIKSVVEAKWGVVQETPEARVASIKKWQEYLTTETIAKADHENGAALFKKSCATCHKLYGEGKAIAPDLTGANRSNLEYLLMNIVDPSSIVPKQFTTSVIALKDGRVVNGVIVSETEQTLVIQTDKEQLTVARADVEETKNTGKSLMPDGMLDSLTQEQVRDLFGYMMPKKN